MLRHHLTHWRNESWLVTAGLTPASLPGYPQTAVARRVPEARIARDLSNGDKRRPWRTPSRIVIREGASLKGKSDIAHCEIRSSRNIHVTGRFWLCRLCFFENSMPSTPAEEIFHALDSVRIGLQEARLPWFCRSSGTGWRNINGVTVTEMQAARANRTHELLAVRAR